MMIDAVQTLRPEIINCLCIIFYLVASRCVGLTVPVES